MTVVDLSALPFERAVTEHGRATSHLPGFFWYSLPVPVGYFRTVIYGKQLAWVESPYLPEIG